MAEATKTTRLNLDRMVVYEGQFYGPGLAEVPNAAVDSIKATINRVRAADENAGRIVPPASDDMEYIKRSDDLPVPAEPTAAK